MNYITSLTNLNSHPLPSEQRKKPQQKPITKKPGPFCTTPFPAPMPKKTPGMCNPPSLDKTAILGSLFKTIFS